MRSIVRGLVVGAFLLGAAQGSFAKCGDDPGDAAKVLAAREDAAANCDCAASTNHGQYVKCVKERAALATGAPINLPVQCKSAVTKCAAHSVCGKPGFVTCCIPNPPKPTKCKSKKDQAHCEAKGGTVTGSATTGCSSCCDACTNPSGPSCVSSPSGAFLN